MSIGCSTKINVMEQGQPAGDFTPTGMEKLLSKVRRQLLLADYLLQQSAGNRASRPPSEDPGESPGTDSGLLPA
jgi:hypothetical protein